VTVCLAGYWEFEPVDSGSVGSYVAIDKMSDGTIWLAYVNRDSAIRLAHKDTAWEHEDLDTSLVRPDFQSSPPFSFDIGPGDVIGVVGLGRLAERKNSGWSSEALPMPMRDKAFSYDPAGRPSLTFSDSLRNVCLGLKTDSGWDTSVVIQAFQDYTYWGIAFTRPAWRRNGNCAFMECDYWDMGGCIDGYDVSLYTRDSGVWTSDGVGGGLDGGGCGFAALPDASDSIHAFWSARDPYYTNELVCDAVILDSASDIGSACLDSSGRVQCAWVQSDVLKFDLRPEPTQVVRSGTIIARCDITTDTLSEPAIAYCARDGSIWVAHGVGIVGLSDRPIGPVVRGYPRVASIVRDVLFLAEAASNKPQATSLLNAAGRKVAELHAGANDVSALAPGVYFVGDWGGASSKQTGMKRIVVVK